MANELAHAAVAPPSLLTTIADLARDPACDVEKLRVLIAMQRDVMAEEARIAFYQAMAAAQAEMEPIFRAATNEHTRSKWARLEDIDKAIRPIYTKHGFCPTFDCRDQTADLVVVTCRLSHVAGHHEIHTLRGPPDVSGAKGNINKTPIQGVASSVSFIKRQLIGMAFNLVFTDELDNDGNEISPITARQARDLETLLTETGADRAKFLAFLRVDDLADLSSRDYLKARAALEQKKRRMETGGAQGT